MQQKLGQIFHQHVSRAFRRYFHSNSCVDISPVVKQAMESGQPVVALESTIITHGMPYPQNLETALQVEEAVRSQGAVPATIAIIRGRVKVGVDGDMLAELAAMKSPAVKTSRRDFPYVLSKGLNGGTTVSGTIVIANLVGIKVFATGGIGGVHRGGEESMDISADLTELGRNPIAVVSSGVKSILDIKRTLEYLETQGVSVVTYGSSKDFPAFYSPRSGTEAPYNVTTPLEAAALLYSLLELRMSSGMLLAVPIPEEHALAGSEIEKAIQKAVKEAEEEGVHGKEVTPFILSRVNKLTAGKSLVSNIALVKNNAKVAAQLAVEFHKLQKNRLSTTPTAHAASRDLVPDDKRPVVIGGCNMDCVMTIKEDSIKHPEEMVGC
ncbi:pseudouridine-5'-phosphate glycosidase [Anabrus simplex]|uniref:pseudouridine-5'-phosphate glycosidase n=1 Tax=Anabrus simplex TaxID=316456 RepID=UPI0035A26A6E